MTDEAETGRDNRAGSTRRVLLAGAGAAGMVAALAACGEGTGTEGVPGYGGPADSPAAPPPAPTTPAGGDDVAQATLATTDEIPEGGGKLFGAEGIVITQPTAGTFKAFSAVCTHQGCPVTGVDGGTINCDCHFSKFSIADGSVQDGPAPAPLPELDIVVEDDTISLA